MRYRDAKKLRNGDEVTLKSGGTTRRVVSIEDYPANKFVSVLCDDGVEYHHRALR